MAPSRVQWKWKSAIGALTVTAIAVISAGLATVPAAPAGAATATDYTSFVDPFVSTSGDDGNDLPGAEAPNSIAKVNPMTTPNRNHSGYDYAEDQIAGFTSTNLDGVGGSGGGGDLLVVPTSTAYTARPTTASYAHAFSHDDETATPGYYQVGLDSTGGKINAEMTATTRTSMQRYTFPAGQTRRLVLDLNNNFTQRTKSSVTATSLQDGRVALSGSFAGNFNGAAYTMYYYAETGQQAASVTTWGDGTGLDATASRSGSDTGAVIQLADDGTQQADLRITMSPISADQAKTDQQAEVDGKSFDDVRAETKAAWNQRLGSVDITASATSDPDGSLKKLFYTHLYRMFSVPVNATSTSGTYRGVDGAVHKVDDFTYYDGWSSWDDFRKYSVIAYVDPDLYRDMVQSAINLFADQESAGAASMASLMQGVPTVRWERTAVVIADAISKGYTGFSRLDQAYPSLQDLVGYYTGQELRQGYVADRPGTSLERGYDQWALATIADAVGKTSEAADLRKQAALPFANVYKSGAWTAADGTKVGLLTPKDAGGNWTSVDYEKFEAANLYQGTLWQYNWYGAYDMDATIAAMGGTKATQDALAHMFGEDGPDDGSGMLHSNANEIDLQAPYLFNYVGEPAETQKWVRSIYTKETWNRYIATGSTNEVPSANGEFTPPVKSKVYKLDPKGFLPTMDNDAGTMSTMFVAASIGLFPVTAGSSEYQIGSPFFDKATITYNDGRAFTVNAKGVSADDYYVQSASLNGSAYGNTWVDYRDITKGGSLDFTMGATASKWGADSADAYSMSTADGAGDGDGNGSGGGESGTTKSYPVKLSTATIQANADGTVDAATTVTLTGGATYTDHVGADVIAAGHASVSGLPTGVNAKLVVASTTTATLTVTGTITGNARFHLVFTDAALGGGATASSLTGDGVSNASAITLSVASSDRLALQRLVDDASLVRAGNYSYASYQALQSRIAKAQKVLGDAEATSATLRNTTSSLQNAIDGLALDQGAYRVLQGEESDAWSGGQLKNESYQSAGDLGGVTDGSWVSYEHLDFAGVAPKRLSIRYANSQSTDATPSGVTIHAGDKDGPVVGSASLAGTGSWSVYATVDATITDPDTLAQAQQMTLVFSAPAGQSWVSNFDWFQFSAADGDGPAPIVVEAEAWKSNSGNGLKSESSTWNDGSVVNLGATYDGAWLDYGDIDLGSTPVSDVTTHYVTNSNRTGQDSKIDVYLDTFDPSNPGTPNATIDLAVTGADWTHAGTASAKFTKAVTGVHHVYLRLRTTADSSHPYVANIDSVTFVPTAQTTHVLEAEAWTANSGNGLKSETSTWSDGAVVDLGGTYDGAWLDYGDLDLGTEPIVSVSAHYVTNSNRTGKDSRIDVYLDSFDPAAPGTPAASIPLAVTGSDWSHAATATAKLTTSTTGKHRVYLALHTTPDSGHPYVANIDNVTFATGLDTTGLEAAITAAAAAAYEGKASTYGVVDYAVFTRELAAARTLLASDTATQNDVDTRARTLRLATSQLQPEDRLELLHAIDVADAVTADGWTDESWAAFTTALTNAKTVSSDTAATDDAIASATRGLTAATAGLKGRPTTAPDAPSDVTAVRFGTSLTVRWTAPAEDGGSPITAYSIRLDDGHVITVNDPEQTSVVFTWLDPATSYAATVAATNASGTSAPSARAAQTEQTPPAAATGATPGTVTTTAMADSYASDSWPVTPTGEDYNAYILRGFSELPTTVLAPNEDLDGTPTAANDTTMLAINHAATSAQVDRAQTDADNDPSKTMVDALGSNLSTVFTNAVAAGQLPKTEAVLSRITSGLGGADAAKAVYNYKRPYVRMGLASDGGLVYDNKTGGYDGLASSGSYPSGHTFGGYTFGTTMATLLPELAPSLLTRASEYGNNRIILGFHYPLDVIGGRMDSQATVAHRWADPEFQKELLAAHDELESVLTAACQAAGDGDTLTECSGDPYAGMSEAADIALYTQRLDYGFEQVGRSGQALVAPTEAAALLITAFPDLTDAQRTQILEQTALDSGYPLDLTGDGDASWQRINLAKALTATIQIDANGDVTVTNYGNDTVASDTTAAHIAVAGVALDGFDPATQTYVVDWPASRALPSVAAQATAGGATVRVTAGTTSVRSLLASANAPADQVRATRTITVTSANGNSSRQYTVAFWSTADDHLPDTVAVDDPGIGTGPGTGTTPGTGGGAGGNGAGTDPVPGLPGTGSYPGAAIAPTSVDRAGASGQLAWTGAEGIELAALVALLLIILGTLALHRRMRRKREL